MSERSPPPFSPLYPPPHHVPFTCNSCWWICCSWKRRLAHQTPLPARSKSVSPPRSKPVCDRPGGDSCEAANKRRRRGKKKPLLGIIAGNSFNSRRWKTPLNTGGNFANYCSMHLSNLILRLPPCIFLSLSLRCFFPLILHSWVVKWHMLTCYTPSLLKKKKKTTVFLYDLIMGFLLFMLLVKCFNSMVHKWRCSFCPYEDGFRVDIWDRQPQNTAYYLQINQVSHSGFIFQPCKDDSGNFLLSEYNFELEPLR